MNTTMGSSGSGIGSGNSKNSSQLSGINSSGGVAAGDSAAAFMGKLAHASDIRQLR